MIGFYVLFLGVLTTRTPR